MLSYQSFSQDYPRRAAYCVTLSVAAVATVLVAFLAVKTVGAWIEAANLDSQTFGPSVSVRGTGKAVAIPDVATFSFGVQTTAESVEAAQADAAARLNAATDYLKSEGVNEDDIQTLGYDVYPHYEWIEEPCRYGASCPGGRSLPVGFDVNQTVAVKVRDIKRAGELLSGIGKKEVTNISGLSFPVDDLEKVKDEARRLAIGDAKARAGVMSRALGVELDKIQGLYDVDTGGGPYPMYKDGYGGMELQALSVPTPQITPGQQEVTVTVEIQYAIDN